MLAGPCSLFLLLCLCSGNDKGTRGTAFVVYEDIYDAKQALEHLGGFNVQNRYLILQVGCWLGGQTNSRRGEQQAGAWHGAPTVCQLTEQAVCGQHGVSA